MAEDDHQADGDSQRQQHDRPPAGHRTASPVRVMAAGLSSGFAAGKPRLGTWGPSTTCRTALLRRETGADNNAPAIVPPCLRRRPNMAQKRADRGRHAFISVASFGKTCVNYQLVNDECTAYRKGAQAMSDRPEDDCAADVGEQVDENRRNFLSKFGKAAIVAPPVVTALLATSMSSSAIAASTGGRTTTSRSKKTTFIPLAFPLLGLARAPAHAQVLSEAEPAPPPPPPPAPEIVIPPAPPPPTPGPERG